MINTVCHCLAHHTCCFAALLQQPHLLRREATHSYSICNACWYWQEVGQTSITMQLIPEPCDQATIKVPVKMHWKFKTMVSYTAFAKGLHNKQHT
jgi:hypothetical protein